MSVVVSVAVAVVVVVQKNGELLRQSFFNCLWHFTPELTVAWRLQNINKIKYIIYQYKLRVCHGLRLTTPNDYFRVNFDHFLGKHYFLGSLGSTKNGFI